MRPSEKKAPRQLGGRRGADAEGRDLYTDTHCNTEGYPGTFKPLTVTPKRECPVTGAAFTAVLAVVTFAVTWMVCYLAGCVS